MARRPPRLRSLRPRELAPLPERQASTVLRGIATGAEERDALYSSARWRREREAFLKLNALCRPCLAAGHVRAAKVVDHVLGHQDADWLARFWDWGSWQPLCEPCHNAKSAGELAAWRRGLGR